MIYWKGIQILPELNETFNLIYNLNSSTHMTTKVTTPPYRAVPRRQCWWLKVNVKADNNIAETR